MRSMGGVVASAHPLASAAGARMLMAGGNAFDAAVATAAALGVAECYMSGLAGMGVACCYVAAERNVRALDFVPPVPRRLKTTAGRGGSFGNPAQTAGTPGALAGWWELLRRYGSKSPAEVLQPAIELAREGYPLSAFAVEFFEICIERHAAQCEWLDVFTPDRVVPPAGSVLRQPELAATLERILADGPVARCTTVRWARRWRGTCRPKAAGSTRTICATFSLGGRSPWLRPSRTRRCIRRRQPAKASRCC